MKENILQSLEKFSRGNLSENALNLFQTLGYESTRQQPFDDKSFENFAEYITDESNFNRKNAFADEWQYVDLLFQLTGDELSKQVSIFKDTSIDQRINSYLFFVIELKEASYNRTKLSQITREVNKVFQIPVMILFKYGTFLTLAVIDRRPNKIDENKDVLRKVTLIKDINFQNPHRAHIENLYDLSLEQLQANHRISDFLSLHNAWQKTLDVELVTNKFFKDYRKVFDKVEIAVETYIEDKETARLFTQRLFNRLMFIYFVQKKGWLEINGSQNYLRTLFNQANNNNENFFRERLYWLFFHGFSFVGEIRESPTKDWLYEKVGVVPYLNGGLFELEKDGFDERGKIPLENSNFTDILNLFEHYNFTVEESTPLEVQVAIDPEILGRVFEELVTGRHESGSYYTPRQIVSFMCRESLKYYLAPHDKAETIAEFVDEGKGENLANPESILDALKQIRICDPACGSGAYLLGMMQELLRLRESLFTSKHLGDASLYDRKRGIIENNIYGVDKDRFAVQIASLRLWLSLAIESAEPRPLPNLKYKIGCGDALLAPLENDLQPDLHRTALIEQFRSLKAEYAKTYTYEEKSKIDKEIEELRIKIAQSLHHLPEPPKPLQITLAENNIQPLKDKIKRCVDRSEKADAERFQKDLNKLLASIEEWKQKIEIKDYKPDFFDWTVEFAEVIADGGFDVVLANPPYVRMELFKPIKPQLRQNFPKIHSDHADLYVYFFARAMQLLKENGVGTFISSNKWLKAGYGELLRQELLDAKKFHLVVDFGELPVFNAETFPAVFLWENSIREETQTSWTVVKGLEICYNDGLLKHIERLGQVIPAKQFASGKARLAVSATASFLEQMNFKNEKLGAFVNGQILYGIKTGLNDAFIINKSVRDSLIQQDSTSINLIKPLINGDDARRYETHFRENYLLYLIHGIDIDKYPAVKKHLLPFRNKLESRATKQEWYELQQPSTACVPVFENPKIIYPEIAKESRFVLDTGKFYANKTVFSLPTGDFYLLGVLNSSLVWEYLKRTCSVLGDEDKGGRLTLQAIYLEKLPIPNASDEDREAIAKLAKETQNLHTERREKVEQFLLDIGTSAAESSSRNILEQPWSLTDEEFLRRTKSRFDTLIFRNAKDETFDLTEQTIRIEREIDERVAELYGVKLEDK